MRMGRFLRQLHRAVAEDDLARPGDRIVVAVSGGADSMVLLHGLAGLNTAERLGWRLHVAHLNHRTRGAESDADAAFVGEQAGRLGLDATIESADVPAATGPAGGGLEAAGRRARYELFTRLARRLDARVVATAHHADDNAETILQRIIRGTGPRGLAGIPVRRPLAADAVLADGQLVQLVRPLLGFRGRLIRRVAADNGIGFRVDASNLALDPTRNWLRGELIPLLARRANPGVVGALLRLGELSGWVNAFVGETAARTLGALLVDRTDRQITLNAASLADKREILQAEVIRQAILALGGGEADMGLRHLKAVMRLANEPGSEGKQVNLPGGMSAERRGELLVIGRRSAAGAALVAAAERSAGIQAAFPGTTLLPLRRMRLQIELVPNGPGVLERFRRSKTRFEELVDAARLRPPLVVRARRPGDFFFPLGAPGHKKVSDFLTDAKTPPADRDRVCLLCDQLGPVWVMPYRIDDRVRVRESSRELALLRLTPQ